MAVFFAYPVRWRLGWKPVSFLWNYLHRDFRADRREVREKGAGIGALGGAAAGGLIGAALGHPAAGAAIGGGLGLGAGALVGDQLQGQENENYRQDQQIRRNQRDIEQQQSEINRLKRQSEY
jgi:outer membrane lipoprotein SlyB